MYISGFGDHGEPISCSRAKMRVAERWDFPLNFKAPCDKVAVT